jgi:hypothetical protein
MHRTRAIVAGLFLTGTAACTQSPPAPTPAPTSTYVTTTSATPTGSTTSSTADESSALVWGSPQIVEGLLYAALGVRAVVS